MLELDAANIGTLELDGQWVPYYDLYATDFVPTRLKIVDDEYAWLSSILISGHGATLPATIRELRAAGKKPVIIERDGRYNVFVSPP